MVCLWYAHVHFKFKGISYSTVLSILVFLMLGFIGGIPSMFLLGKSLAIIGLVFLIFIFVDSSDGLSPCSPISL